METYFGVTSDIPCPCLLSLFPRRLLGAAWCSLVPKNLPLGRDSSPSLEEGASSNCPSVSPKIWVFSWKSPKPREYKSRIKGGRCSSCGLCLPQKYSHPMVLPAPSPIFLSHLGQSPSPNFLFSPLSCLRTFSVPPLSSSLTLPQTPLCLLHSRAGPWQRWCGQSVSRAHFQVDFPSARSPTVRLAKNKVQDLMRNLLVWMLPCPLLPLPAILVPSLGCPSGSFRGALGAGEHPEAPGLTPPAGEVQTGWQEERESSVANEALDRATADLMLSSVAPLAIPKTYRGDQGSRQREASSSSCQFLQVSNLLPQKLAESMAPSLL